MSGQPGNDAPRDDLRRHVTAACRRWKRAWDSTSQLPAGMVDDIVAAADAYALAYARDCVATLARARDDDTGALAALIEKLARTTDPEGRNTT